MLPNPSSSMKVSFHHKIAFSYSHLVAVEKHHHRHYSHITITVSNVIAIFPLKSPIHIHCDCHVIFIVANMISISKSLLSPLDLMFQLVGYEGSVVFSVSLEFRTLHQQGAIVSHSFISGGFRLCFRCHTYSW